mgnify:CR=1 FL=1
MFRSEYGAVGGAIESKARTVRPRSSSRAIKVCRSVIIAEGLQPFVERVAAVGGRGRYNLSEIARNREISGFAGAVTEFFAECPAEMRRGRKSDGKGDVDDLLAIGWVAERGVRRQKPAALDVVMHAAILFEYLIEPGAGYAEFATYALDRQVARGQIAFDEPAHPLGQGDGAVLLGAGRLGR